MTKLDVIIPVYNVEKHLKKCLDSVLSQTLENIAIICVDDGSTDGCGEILKEYERLDGRIKVVTQENRGLSGARNTGILNSKSDYIMFLDSDDYYHPQMCEKMYNAVVYNGADIAICGVETVSDASYKMDNDWDGYLRLNFSGMQEITNDIVEKTNVVAWNKIYKRPLIEEYHITFPQGLIFEDNPFFFSYMNVAKNIYYLNERLYYYVRHSNTIMATVFSKTNNKKFDFILTSEHYYNFLLENNLFDKNQKLFWFYYLRMFESCTRRLEKEDKPAAIKICSNFLNQFNLEKIKQNVSDTNYETLCHIKNLEVNKLIEPANKRADFIYKLLGFDIFRVKVLKHKNEIYVLGMQILKIKDVINYKEICIFGKRVFEKYS